MPVVNNSILDGGWPGDGINNIDADPRFVDPANGDFRLLPDSPAVDAGGATTSSIDLDGRLRTLGAGPDMGAFERCPTDITLDDEINFADLDRLLDAWTTDEPIADLDASGTVDMGDLNLLLATWNSGCTP